MERKIKVGILFGGKSAEHEVSLQSAKNIVEAIDKNKYEVVLIGIDKQGCWHLNDAKTFLLDENNPELIKLKKSSEELAMIPGDKIQQIVNISEQQTIEHIDVIFPIVHGPYGEDGTIQGMLKLADIPFVGASVSGSAIGMDKDVMKRLLRDTGIPIAQFLVFDNSSKSEIDFNSVKELIGIPLFVKPANLGSSVGINKVHDKVEFDKAVDEAFEYDNKILIEEFIKGREIECSILGNDNPIASLPGEVLSKHQFYSYEAKYIDEDGAILEIPAILPENTITSIQELAIKTFKTLCCEGMARVDFFLTDNNQIVVNELNTIPGFTKISMFPKLWEVSGISYTELINRLIQLAFDRYENEKRLKISLDI